MVEIWVNKKANIALKSETKEVEELEFELTDIFEDVNAQNIKKVMAENIEYLLKREHRWRHVKFPRGYSVVIPEGSYTYELETATDYENTVIRGKNDEVLKDGSFEGDFEIFAKDMNTIVRYGHVLGTIQADELIDITVWFKKEA